MSLAVAEQHRRERPSMSTYPLTWQERESIATDSLRAASAAHVMQLADTNYLIDYASAGHKIAEGQHHLDEALVAGQKLRSEAAFAAVKQGVLEMELWMRARGYDV